MQTTKTVKQMGNMKKSWYRSAWTWCGVAVIIAGGTWMAMNNPTDNTGVLTEYQDGVTGDYMMVLNAAEEKMEYRPFSMAGLTDQLLGEGYEQSAVTWAVYQIDTETDWDQQAVDFGQYMMNYHAYTMDGLYDAMLEEGFTTQQATHAIETLSE
ncbi:MAG: hypothetical protein FWF59_08115 [Turicibacter sp.]|nr:hypothetical protein [Turicibacter sp.]